MGRWRAASLLINRIVSTSISLLDTPNAFRPQRSLLPKVRFPIRPFCIASLASDYGTEIVSESSDFGHNYLFDKKDDEDAGKIQVKAYFLCTSINLKSMQAENLLNIIPPTSRTSNYIVLRFYDFPSQSLGTEEKMSCWRYMVVFQYGSTVLFNVEDHEVEGYLDIVRRYASGLLREMRKDDYAVKEKPMLVEAMEAGLDYIVLKTLDTDSIRIIGSVLGQSIALDYFVSQVDGMVEEFADINRKMEKTGTFTMDRTKLFQLVGKANCNIADVILKVGLFERSEIAWSDAKYAQIDEYLREEYEVNQRFGNLDFKLKFVEQNIHFLQEVLQNRKSELLEWCIIFLLGIENAIGIYEIIHGSTPSLL